MRKLYIIILSACAVILSLCTGIVLVTGNAENSVPVADAAQTDVEMQTQEETGSGIVMEHTKEDRQDVQTQADEDLSASEYLNFERTIDKLIELTNE
jgi:hypothetical protein